MLAKPLKTAHLLLMIQKKYDYRNILTVSLSSKLRKIVDKKQIDVPMNDPNAMCLAMKEYANNPDLAEKCGKTATKI